MGNSLLFLIVCPVYNANNFLVGAINSVLEQHYSNWELLLIDDGSIDGSGDICDSYSKKDKRIKVIHQSNQGQSIARLKGIEKSDGDYVLFLDSDDYYEPNALEILANKLTNNPVDLVLYNAKKKKSTELTDIYDLKEELSHSDKNNVLEECFSKRTAGYLWTYCFKKELFSLSEEIKKRFSKIKYSEDVYLIYQIIKNNANSLSVLTNHLYTYVENDESITHKQNVFKVKDRFNVFNEVYEDLHNNYNIDPKKDVRESIGWTYLSYLSRSAKELDYKTFKEECGLIRQSYIYKKMSNFKKDKFYSLIHFLFKIRMHKMVYSLIRKH